MYRRWSWRGVLGLVAVGFGLLATGRAAVRAQVPPGSLSIPAAPSIARQIPGLRGWNLVAGPPGTDFSAAQGELYTFQAGDVGYEGVQPGRGTTAGYGYWAYFSSQAEVQLAAGTDAPQSITSTAGQWVLIGDPSGTLAATIRGADLVYRPADVPGGYQPTAILAPGQGAWAYSAQGGAITLTPGGPGVPVITSVEPASGPAGTTVTIEGRGFGGSFPGVGNGVASESGVGFFGPHVQLALALAPIVSWSFTEIVIQVPGGFVSPGPAELSMYNYHASRAGSNVVPFTVTPGIAPGGPTPPRAPGF